MADYTVASVPYVNAAPLVHAIEADPSLGVDVVFSVPSALPQHLDSGRAAAILVSSFEAITGQGMRVVGGVAIASQGQVDSVRLFSKRPFGEIRRLALDAASMTSNRLAQIILAEGYQARPDVVSLPPDLGSMLSQADACVLIGDIGYAADGSNLYVLDLGSAWHILTGLPFVWAMWTGREGLTPDLAYRLQLAAARSGFWDGDPELHSFFCEEDRERARLRVARHSSERTGWLVEKTMEYLTERISYHLGPEEWHGLRRFSELATKWGLAPLAQMPTPVTPLTLGLNT